MSLVVTCAQCREEVLEADVLGDEEECLLRDHLLAFHPNTIQPETRGVLLRHFVVTEPPLAGSVGRPATALDLAQRFGDAVQVDLGGGEGERSGAKGQRCGRDGSERGAHGSGAQTEEGMSRLIGISTAALLFALGLLHVYWAAGGKWGTDVTIPKQDGTPLFQPPPAGTLLVAIPLFSAGLVVLGRLGLWGAALPRWVFVAGTWTLVAVFLGRVVGDFRWFGVFKRTRGTAFAWWDTWLFVPLCLLLALGCLVVAVSEG